MTGRVHLHAAGDLAGLPPGTCATVCGVPCGTRETTAYAGLDPERVTCADCLAGQTPATRRDAAGPYRGAFALYRGKLAYLDTFAGLVPCKVTAVGEDLAVTVRVTAARRGYDRGEVMTHPKRYMRDGTATTRRVRGVVPVQCDNPAHVTCYLAVTSWAGDPIPRPDGRWHVYVSKSGALCIMGPEVGRETPQFQAGIKRRVRRALAGAPVTCAACGGPVVFGVPSGTPYHLLTGVAGWVDDPTGRDAAHRVILAGGAQ